MNLLWIEQPSGKRKPEKATQTPSKRFKTGHPLSGKRKANQENEPPGKRRNTNLFSPILPLFKTPSPHKTAPSRLSTPTTPEDIYDKPPSPVKTPTEKSLILKSDLLAKQPLQELAASPDNQLEAIGDNLIASHNPNY